jgi:hypothetical protein
MTRWAFYDGFADARFYMEIKPIDMIAVNVAIPFIPNTDHDSDGNPIPGSFEDIYKSLMAQLVLNFDFGTIAFTYSGGNNGWNNEGSMYLYYGGSFGDLGLDFGVGYHLGDAMWINHPLFIGLGVKYSAGAFGIKFRTVAGIPFEDDKPFGILVDLVPSFAINDNIAIFLNAGIGMNISDGDATVGWYVNPYIRVGAEWGPTFYAGIQMGTGRYSDDDGGRANDTIRFAIPIGIQVGF